MRNQMNQDNGRVSSSRGYSNMNSGYEDDFHRRDWAGQNSDSGGGRDPYQHDRGYDWNRGGRYDEPSYSADRNMSSYRGTDRSMSNYCPHCGNSLQMRQYTGSDDRYFERGGDRAPQYNSNGYDREHGGRDSYDRRWTGGGYEEDRRGR
ncbi:MAG TPA: hypothetical protein VGM39_07720 [Kofleriaceae bacterium]|jgi:hypothetical protein